MGINVKEYLAKLPEERREKIKARAEELIAEELSLAQLRALLNESQAGVAKKMGVQQADISKIERRSDMLVSTLHKYMEAIGLPLDIVVRVPHHGAVRLKYGAKVSSPATRPKQARKAKVSVTRVLKTLEETIAEEAPAPAESRKTARRAAEPMKATSARPQSKAKRTKMI